MRERSTIDFYETWKGEGLKTMAEETLHALGQTALGGEVLERYAFYLGRRLADPALYTEVAGIPFDNPVHVGAGWDKRGRALHGLYHLGFGGAEVGTVPLLGQYGNDKPRMWTITKAHDVGMNRMGFNSKGAEKVAKNLADLGELPFNIGVNIGLNKLMPAEQAPWAHAAVVPYVYPYAAYIALGISSPNTKQVRGLQQRAPLVELTQATQQAMDELGGRKPLFYKLDGDQSQQQLHETFQVAIENGVAGAILINTTTDERIKAKYGPRWATMPGGLSGADPDYRRKATDTMRFAYEEAGDRLEFIGVGALDSAESVVERLKAGASAVQVVTAIRPSWGRVAANVTRDLSNYVRLDELQNVRQYTGVETARGAKY